MTKRQIAHYRITAKLGQGGMGEVYRATDTKLGREVAIKVLPTSFAGNAERITRFNREAKVLAALNHPNIAGISLTPFPTPIPRREYRQKSGLLWATDFCTLCPHHCLCGFVTT